MPTKKSVKKQTKTSTAKKRKKPSTKTVKKKKSSETKTKSKKFQLKKRKDPKRPVSLEDIKEAKSFHGGSFPKVNGRVHQYPEPHEEVQWVILIRRAKNWKSDCLDCFHREKGGEYIPPDMDPRNDPKRSMYRYALEEGTPGNKHKRNLRTKDRYHLMKNKVLKKGDKLELHHHDQDSMDPNKVVILSRCEHLKMHGKTCTEPFSKEAKRKTTGTAKVADKKMKKIKLKRATQPDKSDKKKKKQKAKNKTRTKTKTETKNVRRKK